MNAENSSERVVLNGTRPLLTSKFEARTLTTTKTNIHTLPPPTAPTPPTRLSHTAHPTTTAIVITMTQNTYRTCRTFRTCHTAIKAEWAMRT